MGPTIDVPGGQIEIILRGSDVPEARKDFLLERINGVIATNWQTTKSSTWWSRDHSPFQDDYGLALFHLDGEVIAYFIYRQLTLDGIPVFYGAGTAVSSGYQGRGYYQMMHAHALTAALRASGASPREVYCAWRTRNPSVWISNSRFCKSLAPSLWTGQDDPRLQDACVRLAQELYPGCPIETPTMIMHNVFDDLTEIRKPRRGPTGSMSARLTEMLANPADAIFSVGIVEPSTFHTLSARALSRFRADRV
jgi:hypothetical protein